MVAETLHRRSCAGYRTGGTVHVVINNQVGFTTSPSASRSSVYLTDVARMIQAPIFHVNGDDPEACVRVAELAYEFRQAFNKDVVIDMVRYRRRGHNRGRRPVDDPAADAQPPRPNACPQPADRGAHRSRRHPPGGRQAALRDYQQQLERVFVETKEAIKARPTPVRSSADNGSRGLEKPASQAADYAAAPRWKNNTAITPEVLKQIKDAVHQHPRRLHRAPEAPTTDGAAFGDDQRGRDHQDGQS